MKVHVVVGDDREKWSRKVLGVYSSMTRAYKRANAYMHNNNKDVKFLCDDYKTMSPKKFFEKYGGSLWIQYATIDTRYVC